MTVLLSDSFTGSDGVLLPAHTPDVGGAWALHPTTPTNGLAIKTNRAMATTTASNMDTFGAAVTGDHTVDFDLTVVTAVGSIGVFCRTDATVLTGYYVRWNLATSTWEFFQTIASTSTSLGTYADTATVGASRHCQVVITDAAKQVYIDGTLRITSADNTITADGKVAVRSLGGTATTGGALDNISVASLDVPVFSANPVVTGTRIVGQTLTATDGTATQSPTYTRVWQRDSVTIPAQTASTYVLVTADIGHHVTCLVTATNAFGSANQASNDIGVIAAEAIAADIQFWTAAAGIGGSPVGPFANPSVLFDAVTNPEAAAGDVEYRAMYLKNTHAVRSLTSTLVWIATQTSSATTDVAIGLAPEAAGTDVTTVANESTPPSGVTFTQPASSGAGLSVGTLAPGQAKGVWVRWTVTAGTAPVLADTCTFGWNGTPA